MQKKKASFLIAAPKSNSGKTMVTLGLIHALVKRGLKVQPFKCGPDYIDPMHHSKVSGVPSYNLDLWMADSTHIQEVYSQQSAHADVSVTEGVMGLFDGAKKDEGSSAALSRLLDLPVVLVVDASSVAYSIAPLLFGFKNFDKNINFAGVVFNKVAGDSHFQFLKEAAIDANFKVLGYLPRDERLAMESRHLGLHLPGETKNIEMVAIAADLLEKHVDIDLLLDVSEINTEKRVYRKPEQAKKSIRIAMAKDEAFNFTYQANIDVLNDLGIVKEFSPLHDLILPDADLLWLPGGYPELFAKELAANKVIKQAIVNHIQAGKAVIAECGGMMYLGKSLITNEGQTFAMAGVFDFVTSFENMKLHLGYRELSVNGIKFRGHEFHYSNLIEDKEKCADFNAITARGISIEMPVFRYKNAWASYMHLYLGEKEKMQQLFTELGV